MDARRRIQPPRGQLLRLRVHSREFKPALAAVAALAALAATAALAAYPVHVR